MIVVRRPALGAEVLIPLACFLLPLLGPGGEEEGEQAQLGPQRVEQGEAHQDGDGLDCAGIPSGVVLLGRLAAPAQHVDIEIMAAQGLAVLDLAEKAGAGFQILIHHPAHGQGVHAGKIVPLALHAV